MHKCFHENHMVLNPEKCHKKFIKNKPHDFKITLVRVGHKSSNVKKLQRVLVDNSLKFNTHIKFLR